MTPEEILRAFFAVVTVVAGALAIGYLLTPILDDLLKDLDQWPPLL